MSSSLKDKVYNQTQWKNSLGIQTILIIPYGNSILLQGHSHFLPPMKSIDNPFWVFIEGVKREISLTELCLARNQFHLSPNLQICSITSLYLWAEHLAVETKMLTWSPGVILLFLCVCVGTIELGKSDNKYQRPSSVTLWKYGSTVSAIQWKRYIFGLNRSKIWSISVFGWENYKEMYYPKCLSPPKIQHKAWGTVHSQAPLGSCVSLHELGKRQYKKRKVCYLSYPKLGQKVIKKQLMLVLIKEEINLGWVMKKRIREQRGQRILGCSTYGWHV